MNFFRHINVVIEAGSERKRSENNELKDLNILQRIYYYANEYG